jgi:hypothetical protein
VGGGAGPNSLRFSCKLMVEGSQFDASIAPSTPATITAQPPGARSPDAHHRALCDCVGPLRGCRLRTHRFRPSPGKHRSVRMSFSVRSDARSANSFIPVGRTRPLYLDDSVTSEDRYLPDPPLGIEIDGLPVQCSQDTAHATQGIRKIGRLVFAPHRLASMRGHQAGVCSSSIGPQP